MPHKTHRHQLTPLQISLTLERPENPDNSNWSVWWQNGADFYHPIPEHVYRSNNFNTDSKWIPSCHRRRRRRLIARSLIMVTCSSCSAIDCFLRYWACQQRSIRVSMRLRHSDIANTVHTEAQHSWARTKQVDFSRESWRNEKITLDFLAGIKLTMHSGRKP